MGSNVMCWFVMGFLNLGFVAMGLAKVYCQWWWVSI